MCIGGVIVYVGFSYDYDNDVVFIVVVEQECVGCVCVVECLCVVGLFCEVVSIGFILIVLCVEYLQGVIEVCVGVYVMFDLVMYNVGVNSMDEIVLSVLIIVIGYQFEKGWVIVDVGWMVMSCDCGM